MTVMPACVGPSRTDADFRRKAANSAEAMLSSIRAARLTVEAADRAPAPYVSLRLSESEATADSVITSFASVQPPSASADRLRSELLRQMHAASTVLAELRIAAYRGELDRLEDIAEPLSGIDRRLLRFMKIAPT